MSVKIRKCVLLFLVCSVCFRRLPVCGCCVLSRRAVRAAPGMAASDADTEAAHPRWSSGAPLLKQLNVNVTFSMCADIEVFCILEFIFIQVVVCINNALRVTIQTDCLPIYLW